MSDHVKMLRDMRERFGESPFFSEEREALDAAISSLRQVPEGYVLLPRKLTAENGAKGLLSGEFHETTRHTCASCDGDGYIDDVQCEECEGECSVEVKVPVSWDTIKQIHRTVVDNLAVEANPAPPTSGADAAMEAWHSAVNDASELFGNAPDDRFASRASRVVTYLKNNKPKATPAQAGAVDYGFLVEAAKDVCWFDWSENDDDAVAAVQRLRECLVQLEDS